MLDSPELDQQVANARATYELARRYRSAQQSLLRQGVIARADRRRIACGDGRGRRPISINSSRCRTTKIIPAPFDGIITARYVDPGSSSRSRPHAAAASTPVVAMATLSPLARLRRYAAEHRAVHPRWRSRDDHRHRISGRKFEGAVTRHPSALDRATRTMLVEVDLPNTTARSCPACTRRSTFNVEHASGRRRWCPTTR